MKTMILALFLLTGCMSHQSAPDLVSSEEKVVENKEIKIPNWDDPLFKHWCPESHDNCKKHCNSDCEIES